MRSLLASLLVLSVLAVPAAAARIDPPVDPPSQDLRSPDTRDAALQVPYGTPPASDSDAPWALLGVLPLFGGAAWAVRRRRRVAV